MRKTAIRDLEHEQPHGGGRQDISTEKGTGTPGGDAWEELYRLGEEIGRSWTSPQSSVEILSEMRR